jgi:hypothetical protein
METRVTEVAEVADGGPRIGGVTRPVTDQRGLVTEVVISRAASRVNVFEQWESTDAVERFRGSGPSDDQQSMIVGARVVQHQIAASTDLT